MYVCPSPQMLLHYKSPYYGNQLLTVEFISQSDNRADFYKNFSQIIIDINFAFSTQRKTFINKNKVYTTSLLSQFSLHDSPYKSIYLALLANRFGLDHSALHCFVEAAKSGSTDAMNFIGRIYETQQLKTDLSFKWFARSVRMNSTDALLNLGFHYLNKSDTAKALYYLQKHFEKSANILTAFEIAKILKTDEKTQNLSMRWLLFCAANGFQDSVSEIVISLGVDPAAYQAFFQWLSIATRFNVQLKSQPQFHFSNYLKANLNNDFSIPSMTAIQQQVQAPEPFVQTSTTKNILQHKENVFYQRIWQRSKEYVDTKTAQSMVYMFPAKSGQFSSSQLLLSIFEYCSISYMKRNLAYAAALFKQLQLKTNYGLFNSRLWLSKCKSNNPEDLVACGFLCSLLNDYNTGCELFTKAANLGSEVACEMVGIIHFHGLIDDVRDVEKGLFYFARCQANPISLLYIGVASNENEWIERASQLFRLEAKSGIMYEKVGDLFYQGIKFPKNLVIAKLWYGMAMLRYEQHGLDTNDIIRKLSNAVFDDSSVA